jgi:hypothetical protein
MRATDSSWRATAVSAGETGSLCAGGRETTAVVVEGGIEGKLSRTGLGHDRFIEHQRWVSCEIAASTGRIATLHTTRVNKCSRQPGGHRNTCLRLYPGRFPRRTRLLDGCSAVAQRCAACIMELGLPTAATGRPPRALLGMGRLSDARRGAVGCEVGMRAYPSLAPSLYEGVRHTSRRGCGVWVAGELIEGKQGASVSGGLTSTVIGCCPDSACNCF